VQTHCQPLPVPAFVDNPLYDLEEEEEEEEGTGEGSNVGWLDGVENTPLPHKLGGGAAGAAADSQDQFAGGCCCPCCCCMCRCRCHKRWAGKQAPSGC
jgi:hypothetical protein